MVSGTRYILCMGAMLSGSMSGSFAYVLKMKCLLVAQKSEEKQDKALQSPSDY
jgi:hypothetical protein